MGHSSSHRRKIGPKSRKQRTTDRSAARRRFLDHLEASERGRWKRAWRPTSTEQPDGESEDA